MYTIEWTSAVPRIHKQALLQPKALPYKYLLCWKHFNLTATSLNWIKKRGKHCPLKSSRSAVFPGTHISKQICQNLTKLPARNIKPKVGNTKRIDWFCLWKMYSIFWQICHTSITWNTDPLALSKEELRWVLALLRILRMSDLKIHQRNLVIYIIFLLKGQSGKSLFWISWMS